MATGTTWRKAPPPTVDYSEPFQRSLELIGKRWSGCVVRALLAGPARYNRLLLGIPDISDRVLTERLRELRAEGVLERLVVTGPPVQVSYRLTARGRALAPVVAAVDAWACWAEAPEVGPGRPGSRGR